jgi:hypothetical protein
MPSLFNKVSDRIIRLEKRTLVFIISLVLLSSLNLILFGIISQNAITDSSYNALKNRTDTLESYYSTLQSQHSILKDNYESLEIEYREISSNYTALQMTLDDLQNHRLKEVIEEGKNITMSPGMNLTLTYNLPFSGYAEINLEASGEVYMWVGSSIATDGYYARFPPFPETSSTITTEVPVSPTLFIYLVNVEKSEVVVVLEVGLVY